MAGVFNLQAAITHAKTHEPAMRGSCSSGVRRIVNAAGLSITDGGWYSDIWSNGGKGPTNTPPERVGYKIYATGQTINNIVTSSGQPYVPSPGDIATYYGGNNPQGKWFQMPSDYRSGKYPKGYLYHTTCFLGDNIGWWADGPHGHTDRPYKGIDCYYGVTQGGKPSTHVTIYRYENVDGNVTNIDGVTQVDENGNVIGGVAGDGATVVAGASMPQPNAPRPIMGSRGENTLYMASGGENENALKISAERKEKFNSLRDRFAKEAPELGRDMVLSGESYGSEILKGDQSSKTGRGLKK